MAKPTQHKTKALTPEEREQRELLKYLCEELTDLNEISTIIMSDEGTLPPFYAGAHLGEDREIIPLWGRGADAPDLGAILVRAMRGVERNPDLVNMREELGLSNDWPVSELLDMLVMPDGNSIVEGGEKLRDMSMLFILDGTQVKPAPGYDQETMLHFIGEMQPYAVFVKVPTTRDGRTLTYLWSDLDSYSAEVVYADTPQLLEAAVWEYRLNYALRAEIAEIAAQALDPASELMGQDAAELSALFDTMLMHGFRLYGTTSALKTRQEALDVLREENGDLLVKAPLRRGIEPVGLMGTFREELRGDDQGLILRLDAESDLMRHVWPSIRARDYFLIKVRHGLYREGRDGHLTLRGYSDQALLEWTVADTLPQLYRMARLGSIYEMLAVCGLVESKAYQNVGAISK